MLHNSSAEHQAGNITIGGGQRRLWSQQLIVVIVVVGAQRGIPKQA
jgi:hypothetical protein